MFFKALLISIFSDVCKIQSLFPFLAAFMFQKVMVLIPVIGLFTAPQLVSNITKSLSSPRGKVLILLVAWMVLSVPFSIYPGQSFRFLTGNLWKLLVTFCIIIAYGFSKESLDKMIWSVILAVAIFAIMAFINHSIGRFSLVAEYDPNENALMFVLAFPFIFWKLMDSQGVKKILMASLFCLVIIGIIETKSRGGFIGLIAVVGVCIYQFRRYRKISIIKVALIALLILGIFYFKGGSEYGARIASIFDPASDYNYSEEGGRLTIWKQGLTMMVSNPVLGIGVDAFVAGLGMLFRREEGPWQTAHNSFLQVGAELGFPGLIMYCFMIFSCMRNLRKAAAVQVASKEKLNIITTTAYSLNGSWIGFLVSGSFLSAAYSNLFFILLSFSFAFLNFAMSPAQSKEGEEALPSSQSAANDVPRVGLTPSRPRRYDRNRRARYR